MISGEPVPVEKSAGDNVTGATLNGTGSFVMRAERVGGDTLLARIVQMVAEAQRSRAPIQALADTVSGWFVPGVILAAAIAFAVWSIFGPAPAMGFALVNAVAVLIVACPCALGLATPMAIMVGTGRGARAGVLARNAEALELMEKIDTLVIDKTGTLTLGKPRLAGVIADRRFRRGRIAAPRRQPRARQRAPAGRRHRRRRRRARAEARHRDRFRLADRQGRHRLGRGPPCRDRQPGAA